MKPTRLHQPSSIWHSIQHLKQKLHGDKLQLQNIRSDLNRSKSPIPNRKNTSFYNPSKQNDSYISNQPSQFRNSLGGQKSQEMELKRLHRKEMNEFRQMYEEKMKGMMEGYEKEIEKMKEEYECVIGEKNAYIELLESSIPETEQEPDTPRTARLGEVQQIKEYYQRIVRDAKTKYQSIIETLSYENLQLKQQILNSKNVTFNNPDRLVNHARETLTKYMCSDESSDSQRMFSTSHIDYNSNNSYDNKMKESVIDGSERLSALFRNKFKFNKGELSRGGSSVSISMEEYESNGTWKEESVEGEHPRVLPIVHEKPRRSKHGEEQQYY